MIVLVGIISFALGATFFAIFLWFLAKRKGKQNKSGQDKKKPETSKTIVWICLANGLAWVWCSYILAWLDRIQIAESLSSVAVTEIIGVVAAYCVKSAVENLSKHNRWPDKGNDCNNGKG